MSPKNKKTTGNFQEIPAEEFIARAKSLGVNFGRGNPYERLRYLVKLGLLDHPRRDLSEGTGARYKKPPKIVGYYKYDALDRLVEIDRLLMAGNKILDLKRVLDGKTPSPSIYRDQNTVQGGSGLLGKLGDRNINQITKASFVPQRFSFPVLAFVLLPFVVFTVVLGSLALGGDVAGRFLQTPTIDSVAHPRGELGRSFAHPGGEETTNQTLGVRDEVQTFGNLVYQTLSDIASTVVRPFTNLALVMLHGPDWNVTYQFAYEPPYGSEPDGSRPDTSSPESISDIPSLAPTGAFSVSGDSAIDGTLTLKQLIVNGQTTLGSQYTDFITVNGSFKSDLLPGKTASYNLGSGGERWKSGYFSDNIFVGDETKIGSDGITTKGSAYYKTTGGGSIYLQADSGKVYLGQGTNTLSNADNNTALTIDPSGTGAINFHSAANNIDSSGNLTIAGTLTAAGGTSSTGQLIVTTTTTPQLSVRYDSSNKFDTSVSSTGAVTLDASGTGAAFTFSDGVTANTFASSGATITGGTINGTTIGASSPSTGAFTTLTSTGATTLATGSSLTNTFGSGASSINTIGSTTTPGVLTLHGATTLDNTFTVSGSNLTSLGGNLTVSGTAWTATPTISGLITATSGLTANGTLTANGDTDIGDAATDTLTITSVVDSNLSFIKEVARTIQITDSTTANTAGAALTIKGAAGAATNAAGGALTLTTGAGKGTGLSGASQLSTGAADSGTATGTTTISTGNATAAASGALTLSTGTTTTSGTTGAIGITTGNSAGQAGNISLDVGTSVSGNGSILIGTAARTQTITIGNSTGGTITIGATSGSDLVLNDANWSVTGAGVANFASVGATTAGTGAFTTLTSNNTTTIGNGSGIITSLGNAGGAAAINVTSGTGAQTFTSNVATGTTTTSAFVFDATAITSGTGAYVTTDSVTTGRLVDVATTGNTWTGNSTTSGLVNVASTSTAGTASDSDILLNITRSGANTNTAHTAYGVYSNVTNTNATSGTNIAGYFSASGATTANYGLLVANGNVGIGTTSPQAPLEVIGSSNTTTFRNTSSITYGGIRIYNDQNSGFRALEIDYSGSSYGSTLLASGPTGESAAITTTGSYPLAFGTNNTFRMGIASGGNVGIGTASPGTTLDVTGTGRFSSTLTASSGFTVTTGTISLTTNAASTFALAANTASAFRFTDGTNAYQTIDTRTATSGVSAFTLATGTAPTIASAATAYFNSSTFTPGTVNFSGSTQITSTGTSANNAMLFNQPTINRTDAATSLTIDQASNLFVNGPTIASHATVGQTETITAAAALRIGAGSSVAGTRGVVTNAYGLYVDPPTGATNNYAAVFAGGNVGIGTTAPATKLDVISTDQNAATIRIAGTTTSVYGRLSFKGTSTIAGVVNRADAAADLYFGESTDTGKYIFRGGQMQIDASVTTYTQRLCHNGADGATTSLLLGDCAAVGQADFAEYYGTDGSPEAGDVVSIDKTRVPVEVMDSASNKPSSKAWVVKSEKPYQPEILGIVSTNPFAEVLGEGLFTPEEHPQPIALNGRVPVKVSIENGPIKPGDYLTSSTIPGVAMKATKAGRVIGAALGSFNGTQGSNGTDVGKIIVFVNPTYYLGQTFLADGSMSSSQSTVESRKLEQAAAQLSTIDYQLSTVINPNGTLKSAYAGQILTAEQIQRLVKEEIDRYVASGSFVNGSSLIGSSTASPTPGVSQDAASHTPGVLPNGSEATASAEASSSAALARLDSARFAKQNQQKLDELNKLLSSTDLSLSTLILTGQAKLADTNVAGIFSQDGTFLIDKGRQVNVLGDTLYLQNDPLAGCLSTSQGAKPTSEVTRLSDGQAPTATPSDGECSRRILVDIGSGKATFDRDGNLKIMGEVAAVSISLKENKSTGTGKVGVGQMTTFITTTLVNKKSKVVVTFNTDYSPASRYFVSDKKEGEGFEVKLDKPVGEDAEFDWLIVNAN